MFLFYNDHEEPKFILSLSHTQRPIAINTQWYNMIQQMRVNLWLKKSIQQMHCVLGFITFAKDLLKSTVPRLFDEIIKKMNICDLFLKICPQKD